MKGIKLFLSVCLGILAFHGAYADDADDAARAATRRGTVTTVSSSRTTPTQATNESQRTTSSNTISRTTHISAATTSGATTSRTSGASTRGENVVVRDVATRATSADGTGNVTARTATNVLPRASTSGASVVSSATRSAVRSAVSTPRTTSGTRSVSTTGRGGGTTVSRAATTGRVARSAATPSAGTGLRQPQGTSAANRIARTGTITAEEIMSRDITTCRQVYYDCMDEFCANKDSQLKRCACSSRINEFDEIKAQLAEIEEMLLDFNQNLLTVNMDKEDAEALSVATEGELAFQQEDRSDSKALLDEISERLNDTFDNTTFGENLAPVSLTLNIDAAFDSVDSMMGSSTTALSGTELYSAALPVCREMALEVCSQDELDIVESGYQMLIEQDCNTVKKAYETQQEQARERIREGSALLDMSRLNIYQQRNSDDILTCRKKMLDMLTNTTVCGEDMEKCLDITGQYIDPSTGQAILTTELVNFANLIVRPDGDKKWTDAPENQKFVLFLNSKKKYLETATENCQDISGYIWAEFIEDALAQIKLAQDAKMEEVRQSCTTLTTQCLSDSADSLEDFDARALSIFGVEADKTVKEMCSEVQNACTALLELPAGDTGDDTGTETPDWGTGMTEIALDKTYDTIIQTCREVGRNCIVQSCRSISGNLALCQDINNSANRKRIINRTACWQDVQECIADAGNDTVSQVFNRLEDRGIVTNGTFYDQTYGAGQYQLTNTQNVNTCTSDGTTNCLYDLCATECADPESYTCHLCRITEKIWGNCEAAPDTDLSSLDSTEADSRHNQIKVIPSTNSDNETLMSWFAKNTNTDSESKSCYVSKCLPGYFYNEDISRCVPVGYYSGDGEYCPSDEFWRFSVGDITNCCKFENTPKTYRDAFGNCCNKEPTKNITGLDWNTNISYFSQKTATRITATLRANGSFEGQSVPPAEGLCLPGNITFVATMQNNNSAYGGIGDRLFLVCVGGTVEYPETGKTAEYPSGKTIQCTRGTFMFINKTSRDYYIPSYDVGTGKYPMAQWYIPARNAEEPTTRPGNQWPDGVTPTNWSISFQ